jgi:hypothetical protein
MLYVHSNKYGKFKIKYEISKICVLNLTVIQIHPAIQELLYDSRFTNSVY